MANYAMSNHTLRFDFTGSPYLLRVMYGTTSIASYDLDEATTSISVHVDDDDYVVATSSPINENQNPHKLQIGESGSQSFTDATLTGIGVMDLRDMGKDGDFTATYDLECGPVKICTTEGPYPLWIKPSSSGCWSYVEN